MSWRLSNDKDLQIIKKFLLLNEKAGIQILDLIKYNGVIVFPDPRETLILIEERKSQINSILVLTSRGLVYPIFSLDYIVDHDKTRNEDLDKLLKLINFPLHAAIGLNRNVKIYDNLVNKEIKQRNTYVLLSREIQAPLTGASIKNIYIAKESDFKKILPLEYSYQKEEVIISIKDFNKNAILNNLKNKINKYDYYYLQSKKQVLSKGCVTHKSINYVLLGGIFTVHNYRNKGLATNIVSYIVNDQLKKGYKSALFVKKENFIAQKVYNKLDFKFPLDYSIYYYK